MAGPQQTAPPVLAAEQVAFFESFGFLKLPALFDAAEVARIEAGFEEVFAAAEGRTVETFEDVHFGQRRESIPRILDFSDKLSWLRHDPRVDGVVRSIVGDHYEYAESSGDRFYCETGWHCDVYGSPMDQLHIRFALYLDPIDGDVGALRVIPGTNNFRDEFARTLRKQLVAERGAAYGVPPDQIPSWTLPSEPGDALVFAFRTIHGAFGTRPDGPRRYVNMAFKEPAAAS